MRQCACAYAGRTAECSTEGGTAAEVGALLARPDKALFIDAVDDSDEVRRRVRGEGSPPETPRGNQTNFDRV